MKKDFIQKLSIAMASALVITSVAPAATADAATMGMNKTSKILYLNADNSTKTASDFDFNITNKGKDYKKKYTFKWSVTKDGIVDLNTKNGQVEAVGIGKTTVQCKVYKKTTNKLYKTIKATVEVKANADKVVITNSPENGEIAVGSSFDFNRTMKNANGGKATDKTEWLLFADADLTEELPADIATVDSQGVVTAKKAGDFYVVARTYQSKATKERTTALSDAVKVTVPVAMTNIDLTKVNTITLSFDSSVKEIVKNPSDVVIQSVATNRVKFTPKTATVSEDGKTVVVETYQNFANDTTYAVTVGEISKEFKAQIGTISSILVENQVVPEVGTGTPKVLPFTVLDEYGVDITSMYKYDSNSITVNSSVNGSSFVDADGKMQMHKVGDQVSVQLTFAKFNPTTGADESVKSNIAIITCGETTAAATSKWSIAKAGDSTKAYDKIVNTIAANDTDKQLYVTLKDNFGNEYLATNFESMNSDILEVTSDGVLYPFKQGNAIIKVTAGNYTDYITIQVKAEAKFKTVVASTTAYSLSNASAVADSKEITFTLKNIYDETYTKGDITTGTLTEISNTNGAVTPSDTTLAFVDGEAKVTFRPTSSSVVGTATYKLTVNGSVAVVSISVKAPGGTTTYRMDADKTEIDNFDNTKNVANISVFHVDNANVLVAPANTSDFNWILKDAKGNEALKGNLAGDNVITIDAIASNLEAGTYVLEVNNGPVKKVVTLTVKSSKKVAQIVLNKNTVAVNGDVNATLKEICTFKLNGKEVAKTDVTSVVYKYFALDKGTVTGNVAAADGTVTGGSFVIAADKQARVRVVEVEFVVDGVTYTAPLAANITVTAN